MKKNTGSYSKAYNKKAASILILFLIILSLLFLAACSKSNQLVLSGTIESTQIDANSEVAGKVTSIGKEEGALIKKGDTLAAIDPSIQELTVRQQESVVKMKKARLDELKAGSRTEQIQQAEANVKAAKAKLDELNAGSRPEQIKQAQAAAAAAKTAVDTAEINYNYLLDKYNKVKSLYSSNGASENDIADAQFKLDSANQQLLSAREQLRSAQSQLELLQNGATAQSIQAAQANYEQAAAQLDLLKKGSTSQAIQAAEAELEQSQAALEQSRLVLGKYQVKAPVDGTLLLKNVNVGDMVNAGTSVGTISDLSDLWVKVYIPQKYVNFISLNQEIDLKSIAEPAKLIKGKIISISNEAEFTPKNTETSEAKENTVIRFKIKITDTNGVSLKPGMTVEAYIPTGGK